MRRVGLLATVVLAAVAVGYVGIMGSGEPYVDLDCSGEGYSVTTRAAAEPLKDPSGLCEQKRDALHPTLFDLRVHTEQLLGFHDYTGERTPYVYVYLANNSSHRVPCSEASKFVRTHNVTVAFGPTGCGVGATGSLTTTEGKTDQ